MNKNILMSIALMVTTLFVFSCKKKEDPKPDTIEKKDDKVKDDGKPEKPLPKDPKFVVVFKTTEADKVVEFQVFTENYDIDWGDGSRGHNEFEHKYKKKGEYTVTFTGTMAQIAFDSPAFITVKNWGANKWGNMEGMFSNCDNLETIEATDVPDLSECHTFANMFANCKKFTDSNNALKDWKTSNVTSMYETFQDCLLFNGDISKWNTSNVKFMGHMLESATSFDQDISGWDVSKVTGMNSMFHNAKVFNANISDWKTGEVDDMKYMFKRTQKFDQDLSGWNVSKVTKYTEFYQSSNFSSPCNQIPKRFLRNCP